LNLAEEIYIDFCWWKGLEEIRGIGLDEGSPPAGESEVYF